MPIHAWTRVDAGIFHALHTTWVGALQTALNEGLLTGGYYALAEHHAGRPITDVLTLHASAVPDQPLSLPLPPAPATSGVAVAEAPPQTRRKRTLEPAALVRRRALAIRHVSGHRLVALLEIVWPANKDRVRHVEEFTGKLLSALRAGVHVLLVDLFPPGPHDPKGLHGVLLRELEDSDERYDLPADEPLTLASYVADMPGVDAYTEHRAVGAALPEMPLFLNPERYVNVPLESTYQAAYRGMPAFWREVLERPGPPG
ncbi:MAG: DUF4058 family protein [Planctomycetes bacterium]|nr:DUF4058 family protein [Planctomycetota bacterium]